MILRVVKELRDGSYNCTIIISEQTPAETELFKDFGDQEVEQGGAFLSRTMSTANVTEPFNITNQTLILTVTTGGVPITVTMTGAETTIAAVVTKINTDTASTIASALAGPKLQLQNVTSFRIDEASTALTTLKLRYGTYATMTLDSNLVNFTSDFPLHQSFEISDDLTQEEAEDEALAWITQMRWLLKDTLDTLKAETDDFSGEYFDTI